MALSLSQLGNYRSEKERHEKLLIATGGRLHLRPFLCKIVLQTATVIEAILVR